MAWTTPRTWTTGELVTAAIMNTHVRDNFNTTPAALVTALGDLTPATGTSAMARLGVGANNSKLFADSACTVGMRWQLGGFSPFNAPPTANNEDDEFADSSLSASWTEWDPASVMTVTESAFGLEQTSASSASVLWQGIYKSAPASPYTVWTFAGNIGQNTGTSAETSLLFLQDGASAANTDLYAYTLSRGVSAACIRFIRANDYTNAGGVQLSSIVSNDTGFRVPGMFLRARYGNGSLAMDYSHNGIGWTNFSSSAINFVPLHVAIGGTNNTTASTTNLFPFFRVVAGSNFQQVMMGGRA